MNTNPCEKEIDYIRQSLNKFNEEIVGSDGHTPLNIIEYDKDGNIIGGLLGGTYWGWMYIDILWVHQNHRKKQWMQHCMKHFRLIIICCAGDVHHQQKKHQHSTRPLNIR